MKIKLIYPRVEDVISIHNHIIEISGGLEGIKNFGYIDSPLNFIQNDEYYPEFEDKITHLVFSINKNHAFEDGNKRTSIAIGALFLELNDFHHKVTKFIVEMENIAVLVADNFIDKDFLKEIIYSIVFQDDYDEIVKVKMTDVLSKIKPKDSLIDDVIEDVY